MLVGRLPLSVHPLEGRRADKRISWCAKQEISFFTSRLFCLRAEQRNWKVIRQPRKNIQGVESLSLWNLFFRLQRNVPFDWREIYISAATKNVLQPQKKTNQLSQCFQIFLAFSVSQNCHGQSIFPAPEFWVPSIGVFLGPFKFFKTPPRFLKFLQFLKCFQFDCNPPVPLRGNILMETDIIWSS